MIHIGIFYLLNMFPFIIKWLKCLPKFRYDRVYYSSECRQYIISLWILAEHLSI